MRFGKRKHKSPSVIIMFERTVANSDYKVENKTFVYLIYLSIKFRGYLISRFKKFYILHFTLYPISQFLANIAKIYTREILYL